MAAGRPGTSGAAAAVEALLIRGARRLAARAGSAPAARLEAEVLLAHAAGCPRAGLLARDTLDAAAVARFEALLAERAERARPVAYLVGRRDFRDLALAVDERVLVPRPESETLVERLEALLDGGAVPPGPVVDRGTGSGNLALSLCGRRPVLALDRSAAALEVAALNAARHGRGRGVLLLVADGLSSVADGAVAAVVANPPYVEGHEWERLDEDVRGHEPREALVPSEPDVPAMFARLLAEARRVLVPGGWLLTEVGAGQAPGVAAAARAAGFERVAVTDDLSGIGRVVEGRRPPGADADRKTVRRSPGSR